MCFICINITNEHSWLHFSKNELFSELVDHQNRSKKYYNV